jgi:hypothetical protein
MTIDRIREVVARWRATAEKNGCRDCGDKSTLQLRGQPSLHAILRGKGDKWDIIRQAVAERGWYCKSCAEKKVEVEVDEPDPTPEEEQQQQGMGERYPPGDYAPGTNEWEEQAIYALWPLKQPFEDVTVSERQEGAKEYARRAIEVWPNEEDRRYYMTVLEKTNPPLFDIPV